MSPGYYVRVDDEWVDQYPVEEEEEPPVPSTVNLLTAQQASLEDGTVSGWETLNFDTLSNIGSTASHGTRSLQVEDPGFMQFSVKPTTRPAVVAGQVYSFVADVKRISGSNVSVYLYIKWFNASDATIGATVIGSNVAINTSTFTQVTLTNKTAPAGAVSVSLHIEANGSGAIHAIDRIGVLEGDTIDWALPAA